MPNELIGDSALPSASVDDVPSRGRVFMVASEQTLTTGKQLDTLSINTIRTLSIDGVQKANSGHPGRAHGAWRRWLTRCGSSFCATIPNDPLWPNRDRFVLSAGMPRCCCTRCSTCPECAAVNPKYERLGESAVSLDDIKTVPPARQQDSRTSRIPHHRRCRNHHRPAGPGRRQQRGHGDRRQVAGGALQPAGL